MRTTRATNLICPYSSPATVYVKLTLCPTRRLDKDNKGYVTINDWARPEAVPQLSEFTRLYLQRAHSADARHKDVKEVRG